MWAAEYETAVRSAVDTARLAGAGSFQTILQTIVDCAANTLCEWAWVITGGALMDDVKVLSI